MKKIMILLIAVLTMTLTAQAQIKFGLKGGINLTNMKVDNVSDVDMSSRTGFHIGPTVKLTLPVVGLSFDASALYDQRSAKTKTGDGSKTLKQQSLQVPVNVRYGIGLGSVANLFAFAGPQFGFNIGEKHQTIIKDAAEWTLKDSNFSANVGIGATVLNHLQVTVNYNIPFGKTGEVELKDSNKKWDGKANAWQISAAYYF